MNFKFWKKKEYPQPYKNKYQLWYESMKPEARRNYDEAQAMKMANRLKYEKLQKIKLDIQEQELSLESEKLKTKIVEEKNERYSYDDDEFEEERDNPLSEVLKGVANGIIDQGTKNISPNNNRESSPHPRRIKTDKGNSRKDDKMIVRIE